MTARRKLTKRRPRRRRGKEAVARVLAQSRTNADAVVDFLFGGFCAVLAYDALLRSAVAAKHPVAPAAPALDDGKTLEVVETAPGEFEVEKRGGGR